MKEQTIEWEKINLKFRPSEGLYPKNIPRIYQISYTYVYLYIPRRTLKTQYYKTDNAVKQIGLKI